LETPKDIAIKSGETNVWDKALPSCKFSRRSAQSSVLGQKYVFFLIHAIHLNAIHFYKALVELVSSSIDM